MSRAYLFYAVFLLIGLGLLLWLVTRLRDGLEERQKVVDKNPRKYIAPEHKAGDPHYDRKGRIAAIRMLQSTTAGERVLFWAQGNLVMVRKKHWDQDDLVYEKSQISRPALHKLMQDCQQRPAGTVNVEDILVRLTTAEHEMTDRRLSLSACHQILTPVFVGRRFKPHTLRAVKLIAEALDEKNDLAAWPIRRLSLAKLTKQGSEILRRRETVARIQEVFSGSHRFQSGDLRAKVRAEVLVDL